MVSSYGIIKGKPLEDALYLLLDIVEKPMLADAPSRMGAIGRYVFTPEIFDCLHATRQGVGGEIQLTDAIRLLNDRQNIYAYEFRAAGMTPGTGWGTWKRSSTLHLSRMISGRI